MAKTELGETWASAVAAVTIGGVCYLVADRFRVPPLVVVVPAIVPLLPGLAIYRGLALLAGGEDGVLQLASALATAVALASGVILGQYIARPLKLEAHRLETRLAGPRMVGLRRRNETTDPSPPPVPASPAAALLGPGSTSGCEVLARCGPTRPGVGRPPPGVRPGSAAATTGSAPGRSGGGCACRDKRSER